MEVKEVRLDSIHVSENTSRAHYDENQMQDLMRSIVENGVLQAVGVAPQPGSKDQYSLIFGYRRFLASQKLGRVTIPCNVLTHVDSESHPVLNHIENTVRSNPSRLDMSRRFYQEGQDGFTPLEISIKYSLHEKEVQDLIQTFKAIPAKYRNKLHSDADGKDRPGLVTYSKAVRILTLEKSWNLTNIQLESMFEACRDKRVTKEVLEQLPGPLEAGRSLAEAITDAVKTAASQRAFQRKTAVFTVKIKKWDELKKQYGMRESELVTHAIKTRDVAMLKAIASALL